MTMIDTEAPAFRTLPIANARQTRREAKLTLGSRRYRWLLCIAIFSDMITVTARLLPAQIVGWSIDQLRSGQHGNVHNALLWMLIVSNLLLILGLCFNFVKYTMISNFARDLRVRLIRAALRIPSNVIEQAGTGDLLSRDSSDIEKIVEATDNLVGNLVGYILYLLVIFILVFLTSPILALATMAGILTFYPGLRWYLRRSRTAYLRESAANAMIYQELAVTVEGAHTIDTFGLHPERRKSLHHSMVHHLNASLRTASLRQILTFCVELGIFLPVPAWMLMSYWGYHHQWFSVGAITTIGLYILQMYHPVESILYWLDQAQSAYSGYSRIVGVDLVPQISYPDPLPIPIGKDLVIDQVSFSYPKAKKPTLSEVNLTIHPGERIAIVGPSGAGKTTLAKLISGFDFPTEGSVTFGKVSLKDIPVRQLREYISLVTQEHYIFIGTIAENVRIARSDATELEISHALDAVGADWAFKLGLETVVGDGRYELSAAQAQHIALARVVLANPDIIILDEATSLLDPRSAREAEKGLSHVLNDRTVIAIAHRLYSAQVADRIAVIEHGRIHELGTHDELLALNGTYTRLWEAWNKQ